jgi:N-acyl amino acid synthase FeeM
MQDPVTSSTTYRLGARTSPTAFPAGLLNVEVMRKAGGHRENRRKPPHQTATVFTQSELAARRAAHEIPAMSFADMRVSAAQSHEEFEAACGLVGERYRLRGYEFDGAAGGIDAACQDARSRREITFVAVNRDATIGTITLRLDGPSGLRAEGTHRHVVQEIRAEGRQLCELTRLAVADSVRSRPVLAALFQLAYAAADALHGVTDVFIEVNPRHVSFYTRVLGFAVAAGESICERVRAPSVLLHAEMDALGGRLGVLARRALPEPAQAA